MAEQVDMETALRVFRRVFPEACRIVDSLWEDGPLLRISWRTRNPTGKRLGFVSLSFFSLQDERALEMLAESVLQEEFLPQIEDRERIWRYQRKMARALGIPEDCMPLGSRYGLFTWRDKLAWCIEQVWRVVKLFRPDLREQR